MSDPNLRGLMVDDLTTGRRPLGSRGGVAEYATDANGNTVLVGDGGNHHLASNPMGCVIFGDSMTNLNYVATASLISYSDRGYFCWANAYLGQRFKLLREAGTDGDTTAMMLARIEADVISYAPGYCFVLGGYNDVVSGTMTYADTIANLTSIYQRLNAAGIVVIAISMLPSSTFNTATRQEYVARVNLWMRGYANTHSGIIFVDAYTPLVDPASASGAHVTAYLTDTIHPSTSGAQRIGLAIHNALDGILPPKGFPVALSDLASAAFPYGNIITNSTMQGTGGNAQTGTSGTIAANWNAIREDASSTTVLSKVARTDYPNFEYQQLAITSGSATAATVDLYKSFTLPAGVAVGDVVYGQAEVIASDLVGTTLSDLKVFVAATNGTGIINSYGLGQNNGSIMADGRTLMIRTPDFTIPTGTTALVLTIQAKLAAGAGVATMTLKVGRAEMRRVS